MRFQIQTLVDVTDTGARRSPDSYKNKQQANFDTMYNVIGLRTNPTEFVVEVVEQDAKIFGADYKGKHNVWSVEFYVEAEDSTSTEILEQDFEYVPFISGLDETVNFNKSMFVSSKKSKYRNIIFKQIDK